MIPLEQVTTDPARLSEALAQISRNFERLAAAFPSLPVFIGTGTPNGVITAAPPALYLNRAGGAGTTLYVKESGAGPPATNTGWVGK